jgi:hypothetical protein
MCSPTCRAELDRSLPLAKAGAVSRCLLTCSQTKSMSARSLVQDSGAPTSRSWAARDPLSSSIGICPGFEPGKHCLQRLLVRPDEGLAHGCRCKHLDELRQATAGGGR